MSTLISYFWWCVPTLSPRFSWIQHNKQKMNVIGSMLVIKLKLFPITPYLAPLVDSPNHQAHPYINQSNTPQLLSHNHFSSEMHESKWLDKSFNHTYNPSRFSYERSGGWGSGWERGCGERGVQGGAGLFFSPRSDMGVLLNTFRAVREQQNSPCGGPE